MSKGVIYLRVGRRDTSEEQIKLCEPYLDGSAYDVYKDIGSGIKTPLPSFQKLLENVKAGQVSKVVCATPHVVSRDFAVLANVVDQFKQAEVPLVRADTGSNLVIDIKNEL